MHGSERREQIIRQIQESKAPVSGTKLASLYSVSQQDMRSYLQTAAIY